MVSPKQKCIRLVLTELQKNGMLAMVSNSLYVNTEGKQKQVGKKNLGQTLAQ